MIILIVILGIFLRVYGIGENFVFEGELGKELLYLRQYNLLGKLPLVGMTTSHEWLSYGPFYYWIMMPVFALFKGNPFILFWAALIVSAIGLVIGYLVIKKIADRKVALFSAVLSAISPLLVWQTKLGKLHTFFFVLSPVLMYLLYLVWNGKKKWVFWAGIVFGLMFSFHFSQIPFLGVIILLFWIKRNIYKWIDWIKFGVGILIPNLTLIWQDRNLALWVPYRVLNLAEKNPAGTFQSFAEYFGRNLFWDKRLWILGLAAFVIIFAHYIWSERKNLSRQFLPFYLISSIGLMVFANILHGAPPVHYFLLVFTIVPILFALYLSRYRYGILIIAALFTVNLKGYITTEKPEVFVPYSEQIELANFIVSDAAGRPLSIKRMGPYDYFPEGYSQNYQYLVIWKGGDLIENSANTYTIVEGGGSAYVQK